MKNAIFLMCLSTMVLVSACTKQESKPETSDEPSCENGYSLKLCDFDVIGKSFQSYYYEELDGYTVFGKNDDMMTVYGYLRLHDSSSNYDIIIDSFRINRCDEYDSLRNLPLLVVDSALCEHDTAIVQTHLIVEQFSTEKTIYRHDTIKVIRSESGIYLPYLYGIAATETTFIPYTFVDRCGNEYSESIPDTISQTAGREMGEGFSTYYDAVCNSGDTTILMNLAMLMQNQYLLVGEYVQISQQIDNQKFVSSFLEEIKEQYAIRDEKSFIALFSKYQFDLSDWDVLRPQIESLLADLEKELKQKK